VEGYLRGLATYRPANDRHDAGFTVDSYALVNLYAGIRSPHGAWDVGVFAKNAFNNGTQLSRSATEVEAIGNSLTTFGDLGYRPVTYTPPRQFGLQARYSFGSR
jgi:iron complex outermembrane receptor protein